MPNSYIFALDGGTALLLFVIALAIPFIAVILIFSFFTGLLLKKYNSTKNEGTRRLIRGFIVLVALIGIGLFGAMVYYPASRGSREAAHTRANAPFTIYTPSYIPEGYKIAGSYMEKGQAHFSYKRGREYLAITVYSEEAGRALKCPTYYTELVTSDKCHTVSIGSNIKISPNTEKGMYTVLLNNRVVDISSGWLSDQEIKNIAESLKEDR